MADGTTTTLADTLLDDLDDLSDGDEEENEEEQQGAVVAEEIEEGISGETPKSRHESSFLSNPDLKRHLANIEASPSNNDLIVPSNLLLSKLRDSLHEAHLELQRLYEPKFPELSDLLGNVLQYTRAIELLQNEMDVTKVDFSSILTPNQIITISVAGSTTLGRPLSDEELSQVREQCQLVHSIRSTQETLQKFVESRMNDWAPNISTLLGSPIAAQVLGLVGGLAEVSRIPACNLQVLGQEKTRDLAGKSGVAARPHAGILYACDLVQQAGSLQNKKKALKVVAAKLALAARVDFVNWDTGRPRNNASGVKFRQEIVKKLQQWETPDRAPVLKALPNKQSASRCDTSHCDPLFNMCSYDNFVLT